MTTRSTTNLDTAAALAGRRLAAAARTAAIGVSPHVETPLEQYQRSPKRRGDWVRYLAAKAKHHQ